MPSSPPDSPFSPLPLAQRLALKRKRSITDTTNNSSASSDASESKRQPKTKTTNAKNTKETNKTKNKTHHLSSVIGQLFAFTSPVAALSFLKTKGPTRTQRKSLSQLAGLERAWIDCDQSVPLNVGDLCAMLVEELYVPYQFYLCSTEQSSPRNRFEARQATPPLANSNWPWHPETNNKIKTSGGDGFWQARAGVSEQAWLPSNLATFDSVVHFVQSGSGTGVHVGGGRVLTCAHVVNAHDDDDDVVPSRIGREKIVMFPSGATFLAKCVACLETSDGGQDVAVLELGAEITSRPPCSQPKSQSTSSSSAGHLPASLVATKSAELGDSLFCVGNPSNVDLEDLKGGGLEFEPPTWHTSVGRCLGYVDPDLQREADAQRGRGRAPTRGERKRDAAPVGSGSGGYLQHSCWTYWGHSGAPLFNQVGHVVGLHCAWDDRTGMRHGQKLKHLQEALSMAAEMDS